MLAEPIAESLERVARIAGDPAPAIYERLFEQHPELEAMFVLDTNGSARGHMLAEALECILDFCEGDNYATNFIGSERINHDGIGVSPEVFNTFFTIVADVFREILGTDWTAEIDAAWKSVLAGLDPATSSRTD